MRPVQCLDPALIFPVERQERLRTQVNGDLALAGNSTSLIFRGVDHMSSARNFFYISAAWEWLFRQRKG